MKTKLTLILILSIFKVFSQDIEKIEKTDTVYIYFKVDKNLHQIYHKEKTSNKEINYYNYFFSFPNGQLSFQFAHYTKLFPNVVNKKKSFLKKNKSIILDYDFIEKTGSLRIAELIGYGGFAKKIVYVIDDAETTFFKITLRQVGIISPRNPGIE